MLLLRSNTGSLDPEAWTASASLRSDLDAVLGALTDPASIACWAPVSSRSRAWPGGRQDDNEVLVDARVAIRHQRGLTAQVLRAAVGALLNAGALRTSRRRLEGSLSDPREAELLAA